MTVVRVLIHLAVAGMLLLDTLWLVLGVSVVAGFGASASSSEFDGALGGLLRAAGAAMLVGLVVSGLFAWFWLWAAGALGRGHRVARVLVTVLWGLEALFLLVALVASPAEAAGFAILGLLFVGGLITALWAPQSSRRHFGDLRPVTDPRHTAHAGEAPAGLAPQARPLPIPSAPSPERAQQHPSFPPLPAPRSRFQAPPDGSDDALTRPVNLSHAGRCPGCGTATEPGWAHCSQCGGHLVPSGGNARRAPTAHASLRSTVVPDTRAVVRPLTR